MRGALEPPAHGTPRKYAWGCRCWDCRCANAERKRELRWDYAPSDDWVADLRRHGTLAEYKRGCKCDWCRAANARYVADSRKVS